MPCFIPDQLLGVPGALVEGKSGRGREHLILAAADHQEVSGRDLFHMSEGLELPQEGSDRRRYDPSGDPPWLLPEVSPGQSPQTPPSIDEDHGISPRVPSPESHNDRTAKAHPEQDDPLLIDIRSL